MAANATVFAADIWLNPTQGEIILVATVAVVAAVVINIVSISLTARINNLGAAVEIGGVVLLVVALGIGLVFFKHALGHWVIARRTRIDRLNTAHPPKIGDASGGLVVTVLLDVAWCRKLRQ